jgi:hypothetical protein
MTIDDTRTLITAVQQCDYAYMGIRPADATPAEAPCIMLADATANAVADALAAASEEWPDCNQWALIGSDEQLIRANPQWPPRMRAFREPAQLATFSTAP